jgi:exosortase A
VPVAAWWPALAIVVAGATAWFAGSVAGVAFARHLGLVVMAQGAIVALLGPGAARALAFPIVYLLFLVPFGEVFEAPLQDLTVAILMPLLALVGVPAHVDGVLITTPAGYFEVAEACSGAKFLIAMIAYGALVANVCFVSWRRRAAFMGVALTVPLIANGLRAFGTIWAAELTSVEAATGLDHIVYGWLFFAAVMLLVLAIGWRWFDRDPDAPWFDASALQGVARRTLSPVLAAALIVALAGAGAVAAHAIDERTATLPDRIDLPQVPGWRRVDVATAAPWVPNYPGADHFVYGRYADASGDTVDLAIALFAAQREGAEMVGFGIGAIRENDAWVRVHDLPPLHGGSALRMVHAGPVERETVTWLRIGSITTGDPTKVKLETLRVKLMGGDPAGIAVLLSAERRPNRDSRAAIARFLAAAGAAGAIADTAAGRR